MGGEGDLSPTPLGGAAVSTESLVTIASSVLAIVGAIVASLRMVLRQLLSQQAAREAAQREADAEWRRALIDTQYKIVSSLENHMTDDREALQRIAEHMGQTTEALRGIQMHLIARAGGRPHEG